MRISKSHLHPHLLHVSIFYCEVIIFTFRKLYIILHIRTYITICKTFSLLLEKSHIITFVFPVIKHSAAPVALSKFSVQFLALGSASYSTFFPFFTFLGGTPTSMCNFFRPSDRPSVAHHISGTVLHLIIIFGTHV